MEHTFCVDDCLVKLKHYLPAQAPLKDFIHHNTLHAFQNKPFFEALQSSNAIFGYKTSLAIGEYTNLYRSGIISEAALNWVLEHSDNDWPIEQRREILFSQTDSSRYTRKIGQLRKVWKEKLHIDIDTLVHSNLFKLIGSYLDQGIGYKKFPVDEKGLLNAVEAIEKNAFFSFFRSKRVRSLLFKEEKDLKELLTIIVGDEAYFERYLFDQQFTHPGWSGMVAVIEKKPSSLFDTKSITFEEFVYLELLLEMEVLDNLFGAANWKPIAEWTNQPPVHLLEDVHVTSEWIAKKWWQEAYEMSYFDPVLLGLTADHTSEVQPKTPSFQAYFCIDDREESIRRNIESLDPNCETFGTAAHFNLLIYYRPSGGKFNTQVCPAPLTPSHIILDDKNAKRKRRDVHFHQSSHNWYSGWLIAQTVGFWSAIKLFFNVFRPRVSPGHSSSFEHMSQSSQVIIENEDGAQFEELQVGFTLDEMTKIVHAELNRTGLTQNFAPIVYLFGHGGSSTNNPYYAGYNCGACSGKPSSLNARVFASMANKPEVRELLAMLGIVIPSTTQFVGGLHDTTRDEFVFYDIDLLQEENSLLHQANLKTFDRALENNAKERARQFGSIDIKREASQVHKDVKERSVSLFEPRPELNHSNNCLCIVGRRSLTKHVFLDQRSFLNSYDWTVDHNGEMLASILSAITPVCGGINLEYYFSRVDNENFGSGSKLPHNVIGLFGLANGIEGDLRTGLPIQMVEVHDPLRLMVVIEQKLDMVKHILSTIPAVFAWYQKGWLRLAVIDPETKDTFLFHEGQFENYAPFSQPLNRTKDFVALFESSRENLPVSIIG